MVYYGHTKEDRRTKQTLPQAEWQLLKEHLEEVARLAEERAGKFGAAKLGRLIGLAHDIGKYSAEFQTRLAGGKQKVDHATAGAQELARRLDAVLGKALAFTVAGHHGGLPDGHAGSPYNLPERLSKQEIPDFQAFRQEIELPSLQREDCQALPRPREARMRGFTLAFLIRMLYSCLVDADFLDTERVMSEETAQYRPKRVPMEILLARLETKLAEVAARGSRNPSVVNQARQRILQQCLEKAGQPPNLFTLTVPTGGGKTYSSLAFGLKHATIHNKERIVYVVPYTSIIEQNAQVFREALEPEGSTEAIVLEHHSNFEYPAGSFEDWDPREKTHRLAAENWELPVVVTTAVQFFESLYANKSSRCRKLHNLADSVIILDEAQMLPLPYLQPCLWALAELVLNYGATVVFCTATQPAVKALLPGGLEPVEIMSEPQQLQRLFKRVGVCATDSMRDAELATAMAGEKQVLTIVNTRKHARLLFAQLATHTQAGIYHLSARMCPAHRKQVLAEIRQALDDGSPCRVVSTQLIEAGVDVDFPCVYRAAAGIDSIAQAAGRCNREGRRAQGRVIVFEPEPHGMPSRGLFGLAAGLTRSTIRQLARFEQDLLSLGAIEYYFQQLLELKSDELDQKQILKQLDTGKVNVAFPFATVAQQFELIDSATVPLVVAWDSCAKQLVEEAAAGNLVKGLARRLQPYTVQIYAYEMAALEQVGAIQVFGDYLKVVNDSSFYDERLGLKDAKEVKAPHEVMIL